jgi:predicted ribosomally synthesized peptide with SipW-like signal peptide
MSHKENRRKVRAILAGGLVLGIGAAVTLAAWNDSEFAVGNFGAGHFNMQGSADSVVFADHPSGSPATLNFAVAAGTLSPGDVVAAPYALRLDAETTNAGTVGIASTVNTGTAVDKLSYKIVQIPPNGTCTPEATGTDIIPAETALGEGSVIAPIELSKSTIAGEPGASVLLCIQVTAAANLAQSTLQDVGVQAKWEFVGESVS